MNLWTLKLQQTSKCFILPTFLLTSKCICCLGFSLGDELGFAESLGNVEGEPERRRAISYKNGPPPTATPSVPSTTQLTVSILNNLLEKYRESVNKIFSITTHSSLLYRLQSRILPERIIPTKNSFFLTFLNTFLEYSLSRRFHLYVFYRLK